MTVIDRRLDNEKLVLAAIKEWYKLYDYGPSYRDLQKMTEISLGNVHSTCESLADSGAIYTVPNIARSIRLVKKNRG
jgi:SOS-response transcriptional repressor LexA